MLAFAHANRPRALYQQVFDQMLDGCRAVVPGQRKRVRFENRLVSMGASTIELRASVSVSLRGTSLFKVSKIGQRRVAVHPADRRSGSAEIQVRAPSVPADLDGSGVGHALSSPRLVLEQLDVCIVAEAAVTSLAGDLDEDAEVSQALHDLVGACKRRPEQRQVVLLIEECLECAEFLHDAAELAGEESC
jgi:hypothetical protein